jgi:hypothetical protein
MWYGFNWLRIESSAGCYERSKESSYTKGWHFVDQMDDCQHLKEGTAKYEGVTKSFRTGRLERELQMVQLCTTRCGCIATL